MLEEKSNRKTEIKEQYDLKNIILPKYQALIRNALNKGNNVIVDSVW